MTLGEKIKKYRLLHQMKQKELGEKVGFKKSTADVRINQYESNKMAPKLDIRTAIANTLDIDLEAISDINISSFVDIMYIFFELEEKLGMDIVKKDGKTYLSFDDENEDIETLISYLNLWQTQKNSLMNDEADLNEEKEREYLLWKSRFHKNVEEYYSSKTDEINALYKPYISELKQTSVHAKKTSDITLLLRDIIEAGIHVSVTHKSIGTGVNAQGFTFVVNELLTPTNDDCALLIAKFLFEYNHFIELGADCFTDMQIPEKSLTITYYVAVSSFSVITSQVSELLAFLENKENQTDFSIDSFESDFEEDLDMYYNDIEEEIKRYSK